MMTTEELLNDYPELSTDENNLAKKVADKDIAKEYKTLTIKTDITEDAKESPKNSG